MTIPQPGKLPEKISVSQLWLIHGTLPNVKALTWDQLEARKGQAVRFVRDVLDDPERADEIEDESLEDYAKRRKITITNRGRRTTIMATKRELETQVRELEEENQELQDQLDAIADIVSPEEEEDEDEEDDSLDSNDEEDD